MKFNERLIFLMDITDTQNKTLADGIHVDPSRISQLRTGKRSQPKSEYILKDMANYFSIHCTSEYQRIALADTIGITNLKYKMDRKKLADIIYHWLSGQDFTSSKISDFFESLPTNNMDVFSLSSSSSYVYEQKQSTFIGNDGKRDAVRLIYKYLLNMKTPVTIYLTSDENPDWYLEDMTFMNELRDWRTILINRGFKLIQILRSGSAEFIFDSVIHWLPHYLTGSVEPYYYPRIRDSVFRSTMIIVPGEISLFSMSIANQTQSRATILSSDPIIVASSVATFQDYMKICQPALRACRTEETACECFERFFSYHGTHIQKGLSLSPESMPLHMLNSYYDSPSDSILQLINNLTQSHIQDPYTQNDYTSLDICPLASVEQVRSGKVPILFPKWEHTQKTYYTAETYILHLKNILQLLKTYENYHFIPIPYSEEDDSTILIRENRTAILIRTKEPLIVFEVTHPSLVKVFQEYLLRMADEIQHSAMSRSRIINQIKRLIKSLEQEID